MKHWKVITAGVLGLLLFPLLAWATQITIPSAPGSGYFWVSTSTGAAIYTPFSTTSASCSGNTTCSSFTVFGSSPITISSSGGSGGSGNVSTSTHETAGGIAYWTSNSATPALLGEVATSTLTPSSPLTGSFVQVGSSGSLGCQTASGSQAGCVSSTDWTTFNNKISWGAATSTSVNQFVYTNGNNVLISAASSSLDLPNTALQNSSITITRTNIAGSPSVSLGGTLVLTGLVSTGTAPVAGQVTFFTSSAATPEPLSGSTAFSFSSAGNTLLTVTNASTTNLATTNFWVGSSQLVGNGGTWTFPLASASVVGGSGNAGYIPVWTATDLISYYSPLTYNGTGSLLTVPNASTTALTFSIGWDTSLGTPAGAFLAVGPNGEIIATSSPSGSSYWSLSGNNIYNNNNSGNGSVGVGTSTPSGILAINDTDALVVASTSVWIATPGTNPTVPAGSLVAVVQDWGAGGGGASGGGGSGGSGAYIASTTIGSPAGTVTIVVGQGGGGGTNNNGAGGTGGTGYGAGGNGAAGSGGNSGGGAGGGSTGVTLNGTVIIASGGGGGGAGTGAGGGATGSSGGVGGTGAGAGAGGGGGSGTSGTGGSGTTGGAGGTGGNAQTGTNGSGFTSGSGGGGGSSAGVSGNGITPSGQTGAAGSGGASGGSSSGGAGANGTQADSGGGGGGASSGTGGAGGYPGAGGGTGGGASTVGGKGGAGEVILTFYRLQNSIPSNDIALQFNQSPDSLASRITYQFVGSVNYLVDELDSVAHLFTGGPAPSCGSGCASVMGDDRTMRITTGSSVTSVVVNFANAWSEAPICIPSEESLGDDGMGASTTATTLTITLVSALTTKYIGVLCQSSSNFSW